MRATGRHSAARSRASRCPARTWCSPVATGASGNCSRRNLPQRDADPADLALAPERLWRLEALATGADLPANVDPAEGFIASANTQPEEPVTVGFFFAPGDRLARLRALLGGSETLDTAALQRLQQDVLQPRVLPLRDRLLTLLQPTTLDEQAVCNTLAEWDGSYAATSRGALLFETLFGGIVRGLRLGRRQALYEAIWTSRLLLARAIEEADPDALQHLARRLLRHLARLPAGRAWGDVHRFQLGHALAAIPLLGRRYRLPPFPAEGWQRHAEQDRPPRGRGAPQRHLRRLRAAYLRSCRP